MEFGKVDDLATVDFTLPPEDPRARIMLSGTTHHDARWVHVGPTGWSMKEWVGRVYPPKTPADGYLAAYGRQFTTVELNTTYYRMPDVALLERWRDAVPDDFRFAPKFPQDVSHGRDLAASVALARTFSDRVKVLGAKLGRSFIQLPPGWGPERLEHLGAILDAIDVPVAVEFRHPRWFDRGRLEDSAFQLLQEHRAAAVVTDVAGRRDVLHASLPVPALFLRFIGNGRHAVDDVRIDAWVHRIADWCGRGLGEVMVLPHEPDNLLAPDQTEAWTWRLNAALGLELRSWRPVKATGQLGLF